MNFLRQQLSRGWSPRSRWWLLAGLALVGLTGFAFWPAAFRSLGVDHRGRWFIDLYAVLASGEAYAHGLDPYVFNPLDYFGRVHVYTRWWLWLGQMGLTRDDCIWIGRVLVAAFMGVALFRLRPRSLGEVAWTLAVLLSPPFLLALNRANNDLVIFLLLAPVVPCLSAERVWVRWLALVFIAAAFALKTYPLVAGLLLFALRDGRELRRLLLVSVGLLLALLPEVLRDLAVYGPRVTESHGLMTFGGSLAFAELGCSSALARLASAVCGAGFLAAWLKLNLFARWRIAPEDRGTWVGFVLGATLLTGCFFAGVSFSYRWIFAIWMAPLLWRLPRDASAPRAVRRLAAFAGGLLLWALWADGAASGVIGKFVGEANPDRAMRMADAFSAAEQPLHWAFFLCLLAFLAHFTREGFAVLRARPRA